MVGVDVTDVALAAATANRKANPQLQHLLEVRRSAAAEASPGADTSHAASSNAVRRVEGVLLPAMASATEAFHFCMCNPPFFTSIKEANQNPSTACGGKRLG
jgi:23S rRNA (adenine1618-N6)-methyltransferase